MSTCPISIYQRHVWGTATLVAGKTGFCFLLSLTVRKFFVVILASIMQNLLLIN
jgi:hypothetical protein